MYDEKDFENSTENNDTSEKRINEDAYGTNENATEEVVTPESEETVYEGIYSESERAQFDYSSVPLDEKPKKNNNKIIRFVALAVVFGLIAGAVFGSTSYVTTRVLKNNIKIDTTESTLSKSSGTNTATSSVADITDACMPSIVSITNKSIQEIMTFFGNYSTESTSSGSGIIIGKNESELLVVTNYHVVSESQELSVVFSHSEENPAKITEEGINPDAVVAKVKGYDIDKDLAVLSINLDDISAEIMSNMKIATIGDSSAIRAGEQVVAIGNALGYGQSVTTGIVSAVNREVTMENANGGQVTNTFIQTDAAINPGNSGGALLNMKGELIGINSVKIASNGVEGMGYAIPISDVEAIINNLMLMETRDVVDESEQGYLGIAGQDVTASISQSYGLPVGVYVQEVTAGSAAEKAGIKAGHIITKFDGTTVSSMAELKTRLSYYKAGETKTITVKIQTDGGYEEKDLTVTLDKKPAETSSKSSGGKNKVEIPGIFGN